jgi:hypothetical protein
MDKARTTSMVCLHTKGYVMSRSAGGVQRERAERLFLPVFAVRIARAAVSHLSVQPLHVVRRQVRRGRSQRSGRLQPSSLRQHNLTHVLVSGHPRYSG